MNYQQELQINRMARNVVSPMRIEWQSYKEQHYKYDDCYDYFADIFPLEVKQFELDHPKMKADAENAIMSYLNEQREQPHYFMYTLWLAHKYKHFAKNWKPRDDDGLNFMHITFNFSDKISVNDVILEMIRIVNLAIFDNCKLTYCYEYYTEKGAHPHVHMLVELKRTGTINPSTLEQKVFQKKSLREVMNYKYKLSWARSGKDRCDKRAVILAYVSGNKIEDKQENTVKDKLWRKQYNLEDLYIKDNK